MFGSDKGGKNLMLVLGEILSILMTLVYAVYITNGIYGYLPASPFLYNLLNNLVFYGPLSIIAIISLALVWRRGLILRIVFIAVWALIIIYSFFPAFFEQLF